MGKYDNNYEDYQVQSAEPGIVSGFNVEHLFKYIREIGKNDEPYEGVEFKLAGPVAIRDFIFKPTRNTSPSDKTPEELEAAFAKRCNIAATKLMMYYTTYLPATSKTNLVEASGIAINNDDDLSNNFEAICTALGKKVNADKFNEDHSLIIGREKGKTYLNLPNSVKTTGRYIKLTADEDRELKLSAIWIQNYMFGLEANNAPAASDVNLADAESALTGASWGAETTAE